jgi:hypothetical protein
MFFCIINDQFNSSVDYDWRSDLDVQKIIFLVSKYMHDDSFNLIFFFHK